MEYANGGTLKEYLYKNFVKMDWNLKLKFAKQITSAVLFLHENDIIHKDLVIYLFFLKKNQNSFFKK